MATNSRDPFGVFIEREAFLSRTKANSGKMAWHSADVASSGWGEHDIAECIVFDSLFIEQPTATHGYVLNQDDLMDGAYPRAVGFVRDWKRDPKGFWRGAWVSVCVDAGDGDRTLLPAGYDLTHSFVFSGMSIKPIREDLTARSDAIPNQYRQITPEN